MATMVLHGLPERLQEQRLRTAPEEFVYNIKLFITLRAKYCIVYIVQILNSISFIIIVYYLKCKILHTRNSQK